MVREKVESVLGKIRSSFFSHLLRAYADIRDEEGSST